MSGDKQFQKTFTRRSKPSSNGGHAQKRHKEKSKGKEAVVKEVVAVEGENAEVAAIENGDGRSNGVLKAATPKRKSSEGGHVQKRYKEKSKGKEVVVKEVVADEGENAEVVAIENGKGRSNGVLMAATPKRKSSDGGGGNAEKKQKKQKQEKEKELKEGKEKTGGDVEVKSGEKEKKEKGKDDGDRSVVKQKVEKKKQKQKKELQQGKEKKGGDVEVKSGEKEEGKKEKGKDEGDGGVVKKKVEKKKQGKEFQQGKEKKGEDVEVKSGEKDEGDGSVVKQKVEKKKKKKEQVEERKKDGEEGEGVTVCRFPMSRVDRLIRSQTSDYRIAHEAVFLINKAAEKFLEVFCKDSYETMAQDCKNAVSYKHLSTVVGTDKRFDFLSDHVPEKVLAEKALAETKPAEKAP